MPAIMLRGPAVNQCATVGGAMLPQKESATSILSGFKDRRVVVVGDLVLDHYLVGEVSRISPEAPVPVVAVDRMGERWVPGGAANVARNVISLGGKVSLAGLVGDDERGERLLELLRQTGANVDAVMVDESRPTTTKTRVMSHSQHLLRMDEESDDRAREEITADLAEKVADMLPSCDVLLFEDYDKGALDEKLISDLVKRSLDLEVPVAADPKLRNFFEYRGCTLFKPNRRETERALGVIMDDAASASKAAEELRRRLQAKAVLITLGPEGSVLCEEGRPSFRMPTVAHHVYDVSGAGDTVIAVMALCLAGSVELADASRLAGFAAAAVCAEPGVYAVTSSDVLREVRAYEQDPDRD
ncbi:D-glycero-beta-D-manno-heptose-7-phosphate kinase [Candidatus Fermentibacteria bacterium]|nr:D-glycero-beta-D-manno-heptose-7-phosphate kinase [Candidatus Fermentibacteria bacterium]